MKKILALALVVGFTACSDRGTGDRTDTKPVVTHDQPSSHPNPNGNSADTTSHVQDRSTNLSYDTAARKN